MNKKNNEIWKALSANAEHINDIFKTIIEINKEIEELQEELLKLKKVKGIN